MTECCMRALERNHTTFSAADALCTIMGLGWLGCGMPAREEAAGKAAERNSSYTEVLRRSVDSRPARGISKDA